MPIRLIDGLRRPRTTVRGVDLSGCVQAVGEEVVELAVGEEVFGVADGSFAEQAVTTAERLARTPAGMTYQE